MNDPARRAVITGTGVLAPNGNSTREFWENTLRCRSGIAPISRFPVDDFPVKIAGEIKNFDLKRFVPSSLVMKPNRMGIHTRYAIAATHSALHDAGLSVAALQKEEPVAFFLGVSTSAIEVIEKGTQVLMDKGPRRVSPYFVGACQPHAAVSEVVETLGLRTRNTTFSSACPAGMEALERGLNFIRNGEGDFAVCGGVDAPITPVTMASFHLAGLAPDCPFPPEASSRPFDRDRKGGIISEGAGVVVVESLERALNRGRTPLAEIIGVGDRADDPHGPPASGLSPAITAALNDAALLPSDIDYVNAHGPSHPLLDKIETESLKAVFGEHAYRLPVSSIKGVIGNPLAAAGPLQTIASALAIRDSLLPPTANYQTPDPECDLNYVPNRPLPFKPKHVLVNLHGLGGGNHCLILRALASA